MVIHTERVLMARKQIVSRPVRRADAPAQTAAGPIDPAWAWRPYQPDAERPWSLAWAGHLCRRVGFGASWLELQETLTHGPQKSIDRLLRPTGDIGAFNQSYDAYEAAAAGGEATDDLRSWWLRRMIHTPHPLLEKMTLFWHSYFGISNARVKNARLMHQHVQLPAQASPGLFSSPAPGHALKTRRCCSALTAAANRKAQASQNLARAHDGRL